MKRSILLRAAIIGAIVCLALASVVSSGHNRTAFFGSRFEGPTPALVLPDDRGATFDLATRQGGVTLVTFGYRHCPDVCPTILADLRAVLDRLGRQADRVQVVFVTLDPKRDNAEALRDYLASFTPADGRPFVGLVGDEDATAAAARRWGITWRPTEERRFIDHTAIVVAIDEHGRARLRYGVGQIDGITSVARDIGKLLHEQ